MTTTYYVSRETAIDRASDEDRAMAHVSIYTGDDLADAHSALRRHLRDEAEYLSRGRDMFKPSELWAFKRIVGLLELAECVKEMDPAQNPGSYKTVSREVEGLLFSITAVTR